MTDIRPLNQGRLARRFFLISLAVFGAAGCGAWLLIRFVPSREMGEAVVLPGAFWINTLLLFAGSGLLHRAGEQVRLERQPPFRRALLAALVVGTLFVGVQSYGLWCLLGGQRPAEVSTSASAFVFIFSLLHGLHFTVALLFLVFVVVRAFADRYDHEYYWGVTVCTFFWHLLGLVWIAILAVFAIAD